MPVQYASIESNTCMHSAGYKRFSGRSMERPQLSLLRNESADLIKPQVVAVVASGRQPFKRLAHSIARDSGA